MFISDSENVKMVGLFPVMLGREKHMKGESFFYQVLSRSLDNIILYQKNKVRKITLGEPKRIETEMDWSSHIPEDR